MLGARFAIVTNLWVVVVVDLGQRGEEDMRMTGC